MLITYEAKLVAKKQLNADTYLLQFSRPTDPNWNFAAGQYMIFHLPSPANQPLRRLYSIASPPQNTNCLEFIIQRVPEGKGSPHITNLKIGDSIKLQGPAGAFTYRQSPRDKIFLATGTGIAPIRSMIMAQLNTPTHKEKQSVEQKLLNRLQHLSSQNRLYLFWGMRKAADLYMLDEWKRLQQNHPHFAFSCCLSRDDSYQTTLGDDARYITAGRVTVGLENLLSQYEFDITQFDYYICGGQPVVEGLRQYLTDKKVTTGQIFFERFN